MQLTGLQNALDKGSTVTDAVSVPEPQFPDPLTIKS